MLSSIPIKFGGGGSSNFYLIILISFLPVMWFQINYNDDNDDPEIPVDEFKNSII